MGAALGTNRKSCNPPPSSCSIISAPGQEKIEQSVSLARLNRYHLQSAARHTLNSSKGLNGCCRALIPDLKLDAGTPGQVKVLSGANGHHYGGLMTCGSVWVCPVCATKITEKRRADLVQGVDTWISSGHGVEFLTLTVPHYHNDKLQTVLDGISDAFRRFTNRGGWRGKPATAKKAFRPGLVQKLGIVGRVRTLEVTHGINGWHPHFHVLLFTDKPLSAVQRLEYQQIMLEQWQSACMSAGLPCPNEHGLSLQDGDNAARYASKWGIECEMTKGHLKTGIKAGHVSPFGLLAQCAAGDKKAQCNFREYAAAFTGKRQLVWSDGLRDLLGLGADSTDEELAALQEDKARLFASLPLNVWQSILREEKRGELLDVCSLGLDALYDWIIDLMDDDLRQEHIIRELGALPSHT